jgi:DNA-binding XRE family transcriptional regulator
LEAKEFSRIRHYLGKTQKQLAQQLCVSPKAVQSFEGGWRDIPAYAERQLLLFLSLKRACEGNLRPCWEIVDCPVEWRENCAAWEYKAGFFCWFVSGTFCQGELQGGWDKKMHLCRQCEAFRAMVPPLI